MKPAQFEYTRPKSLQEAVALLSEADANAKVIAGGQSLGPMLNLRLARPGKLVDIRHLPELRAVRADSSSSQSGRPSRMPRSKTSLLRILAAGFCHLWRMASPTAPFEIAALLEVASRMPIL